MEDAGADPADAAADEAQLQAHAEALADAVDAALPRWVERSVTTRLAEAGRSADPYRDEIAEAADRARTEVGGDVRALLQLDIDVQWTNPLALLRRAVAHATDVLDRAGVAPVDRDETDERLFPDDRYGLTPASFADVDPALHEPGIAWGAAKAYVHLARRRREGRR